MKTIRLQRANLILASILALLLPGTLAYSQPPGGGFGPGPGPRGGEGPGPRAGHGPGHGPRGFLPPPGYLDLTEEQKAAAEALREQARAEIEPLREQIRAQREQLHTLLDASNPDAAAVGQLVIGTHALHEQIRTLIESYEQRFAALLTPEQLTKWENFKELRRPHRGGPWGPPDDDEGDA